MSTWITALSDEITAKKLELERLQDVQKQIADLGSEIKKLEGIYANATGAKPVKSSGGKGGRKPWSEEQKQAARDRWAAKKAGTPAVKRVKAVKG